jgi:hypothetical protein
VKTSALIAPFLTFHRVQHARFSINDDVETGMLFSPKKTTRQVDNGICGVDKAVYICSAVDYGKRKNRLTCERNERTSGIIRSQRKQIT